MGRVAYILKRLILAVPLMLIISMLVFTMFSVVPGDPALLMLGEHYTEERYRQLRAELGLDEPLYIRYLSFVYGLLQGNLGRSVIISRQPVSGMVFEAFKATLELTIAATIIAVALGLCIGIVSALKRNTVVDYTLTGYSLFGVCLPVFWTGMLLIIVFSLVLGFLPVTGRVDVTIDFQKTTGFYILDSVLAGNLAALGSVLAHLVLPAFALSLEPTGMIARLTRSSMLEVLSEKYLTTSRALGFSERTVVFKYGLKNALIPTVTEAGMRFGRLLGGAVLTETVFAWPGLGLLTIKAVLARDYPVAVGCVVVFMFVILIANLAVDILYTYLDPRIKY